MQHRRNANKNSLCPRDGYCGRHPSTCHEHNKSRAISQFSQTMVDYDIITKTKSTLCKLLLSSDYITLFHVFMGDSLSAPYYAVMSGITQHTNQLLRPYYRSFSLEGPHLALWVVDGRALVIARSESVVIIVVIIADALDDPAQGRMIVCWS